MINICNVFKKRERERKDGNPKASNSDARLQSDSLHYSVLIKTFSIMNRYYIHNF